MKRIKTLFILLMIATLMSSCSVDKGIAPLPGRLNVTVNFRGTPPENTQGIYLIVAPVFPPHAINELFHSPNSLPINKEVVQTQLVLPYGHYDAISLWWYSTETKSNLADVLALPLDIYNDLLPLGFDLTPQQPETSIELYANWNRVNRDAAIEGTVTFNGPFPENTLATAIAAYKYEPKSQVHYLVYLASIDFSIDSNPYSYRLPVTRGTVEYIAVFWLPERASLADFRTVGVYRDPANPNQAGRLTLKSGETKKGINIQADWSLINQ